MNNVEELINLAISARDLAFAPYSHFKVGAALCASNGESEKIFTDCNIENSSYGLSICAERTAIFKAVSEGYKKILAIAIVGGEDNKQLFDFAMPCGACRQVMAEFGEYETFKIISAISKDNYKINTLKELLQDAFLPNRLGNE